MQKIKKKNPAIASLLSLVTSGLGQIYNTQMKKGIIFYLVSLLLVLILFFSKLYCKFYGTLIFVFIGICAKLYFMADAFINARSTKIKALKFYNRWYMYLLIIILNIAINGFIQNEMGIKAFRIASDSMKPTLLLGDYIIVDQNYYRAKNPQKGDVVLINYPENPSIQIIKRVLAVGGDIVEGHNGNFYVNKKLILKALSENDNSNTKRAEKGHKTHYIRFIAVPKEGFFVIGDNTAHSYDSREFGFIYSKDIKGKVLYIYWSKYKNRIGLDIK